ncbi:hypothetical protein Gpo141_00011549 [Globisporangium polare]
MIVPMTKAQLAVLLVAVVAPAANAHGSMSNPKPTFAIQGDTTQFGLTVDSSALTAPSGMSFTTDPTSNTKAFNAAIKTSSYKSVYALIEAKGVPIAGANKECGITTSTGTKQALPAMVEWSHGSGEGFTPSHEGPCEVWCDDVMAFSDENCSKNYPSAPAKLPYDKTKCAGKSVLKTVWLALHSPTWQAYVNCAAIEGGSGSSASTPAAATPTATTKSPSTTTKSPSTPKSTTKAPSSGGSSTKTPAPAASDADEDCEDELPIAGDSDEDCDLDIKDTPAPASGGEVGGEADEDCADDLPVAGGSSDEDCDLDVADTPAPAAGGATTKAPKATKTPKPTKTKKTKGATRTSDLGFDELEEGTNDVTYTVEPNSSN